MIPICKLHNHVCRGGWQSSHGWRWAGLSAQPCGVTVMRIREANVDSPILPKAAPVGEEVTDPGAEWGCDQSMTVLVPFHVSHCCHWSALQCAACHANTSWMPPFSALSWLCYKPACLLICRLHPGPLAGAALCPLTMAIKKHGCLHG